MTDTVQEKYRFANVSGPITGELDVWEPLLVPRAAIEEQIALLCEGPPPEYGRRATKVVHPKRDATGLGFAPGVDVTINVVMPGETSAPMRRNASEVEICLSGQGTLFCKDKVLTPGKWDVWNIPSMQVHSYQCVGNEPFVRLSYSNAPLLDRLGAHYVDYVLAHDDADTDQPPPTARAAHTRATAPEFRVDSGKSSLLGYEALVDIAVMNNAPLLWPWQEVSQHLSSVEGDGKRTILLLYNPATERRMGTTHSFFATMSAVAGRMDTPPRGHKHTSVAMNYHFMGRGESIVNGSTIAWEAGDLLLSAPPWSEHSHGVGPDGAGVFTVQDHPLHIAMESLVWQERISGPVLALGAEQGVTGYIGPRAVGE